MRNPVALEPKPSSLRPYPDTGARLRHYPGYGRGFAPDIGRHKLNFPGCSPMPFSERTFEFCYNMEYCISNAAILASHPHIPTQRAEKDLGYDVEMKINQGGLVKSLFLQHKVSAYAQHRAGNNGRFYDTHMGPYFRFPVDNEQHNTLLELSRTKGNAFYCSPRFHHSHELETHFTGKSICMNALLLDPQDVGGIADADRHNITYKPSGLDPTLHSEARKFKNSFTGSGENAPELKSSVINKEYIESLSEELMSRTRQSKFKAAVTKELERAKPIERAQILLGRVYQVTWLLLP